MSAMIRPSVFKKLALTLSMAFAASLSGGSEASADVRKHIDNLASRIERKTERLVKELNHYRHTPQYAHLVQDTLEMRNAAQHIHDVVHFENNLAHLQADLACLDRSFHHLEDLFERVERQAAHGHGHIHGNTRHVRNLLNSLERDIHHLTDDVNELRLATAPVVTPTIQYRNYRSSTSGFGSSFHHGVHGFNHSKFHHNGLGRNNIHGHSQNRYAAQPPRGFSIGGGSSRIWISF